MNFFFGLLMSSVWLLNTSADVDSGTQDPEDQGAGGAGSPIGLLLILTHAS